MADEIEIVKTERAAAPDGAEWMDQPPAGVQPDDFVCGLRRGGVKCWIDNDGLVLDHAVFMMTRDLVALITEAVRLGDRQWVSLLAACKDAAVEAANETAAAVTRSLNAVVADVRKAIDADQGANTYDALRAFADSAKVSSRALAEFANMLGCGEGEIGDHIRRIISAVDGCSAGTVATKVEELRNALLVVERSESKRHAEIASAARLLSDAGFSGATLEDRVKAVLRERASLEAENAELVAEIVAPHGSYPAPTHGQVAQRRHQRANDERRGRMTSTTDNDLPDGWEASSITVADEQVAYCISSSTQPDRQVYLTASGALGITAAGDGCWAPARAVAHVLSRADVDSTKAALVLPRGMSAAEAQALLDVAAEAVGYVGEPGTPERQRWADDVMVMGACRETDANKALRSAAREYAKAWDDYKNESRKSAAVGALESAARAFAAATPPHQVETHAGAGREHELKTWPPYFEGVVDGSKTFEVRREDRPFAVGDVLVLREWDPKLERYTGRSTKRSITYLMRGGRFGLERGYVVLGLAAATARNESANADTIAAAAIAYARAVDAADEKSRTAEEYEAANAVGIGEPRPASCHGCAREFQDLADVQRACEGLRLFFAAR